MHERRVSAPCFATESARRERLQLFPGSTVAGERFNLQKSSGTSAIGIQGRCLPMGGLVYWGGRELETTWTLAGMSALVPDDLIEKPGVVTVRVRDGRGFGGDGSFVVLPRSPDRP